MTVIFFFLFQANSTSLSACSANKWKGFVERFCLQTIKKANICGRLKINELNNLNHSLTLQKMQLEINKEFYVWEETAAGFPITLVGPNCYAIQSTLKEVNLSSNSNLNASVVSNSSKVAMFKSLKFVKAS